MKTLDEIKDEYAREKGYNDWSYFYEHCFETAIQNYKPILIEKAFDEVVTRFVAEQTHALRNRIESINIAIDHYWNNGATETNKKIITREQKACADLLTRTANYEN